MTIFSDSSDPIVGSLKHLKANLL